MNKKFDNNKPKHLPFSYCSLDRAAALLNYSQDDLIGLAAENYIDLWVCFTPSTCQTLASVKINKHSAIFKNPELEKDKTTSSTIQITENSSIILHVEHTYHKISDEEKLISCRLAGLWKISSSSIKNDLLFKDTSTPAYNFYLPENDESTLVATTLCRDQNDEIWRISELENSQLWLMRKDFDRIEDYKYNNIPLDKSEDDFQQENVTGEILKEELSKTPKGKALQVIDVLLANIFEDQKYYKKMSGSIYNNINRIIQKDPTENTELPITQRMFLAWMNEIKEMKPEG